MHPSTAEHISRKMARWLLCYEPPQTLVDQVTHIYLTTGGNIKAMIRKILSPLSVSTIPDDQLPKLKRPYHLLTSAMRAAEISTTAPLNLTVELQSMGMVPFWWPTPDGYPDKIESWGKALLPRWEFATRLFGRQVDGNLPEMDTLNALLATAPAGSTTAEAISWVLTGGRVDPSYVAGVQAFLDSQTTQPNVVLREAFALMAQSPNFQYY